MLKLIKYEFRKQLFSKFIILGVIGVVELFFLYGIFTKDENKIGIGMALLVFATIGVVTFVAFESIMTFSRDLKTKQSYMLFLIPKSTYSIVGAKILTALFQLAIVSAAFLLLAALDFTIMMTTIGEFKNIVEALRYFFEEIMNINISADIFIFLFILLMLEWFFIIITAMLSMTLSTTLLSNSKLKGIISTALFVGITYLSSKLMGFILPGIIELNLSYLLYSCMCTLFLVFLAYLATAWMLDKKVSV